MLVSIDKIERRINKVNSLANCKNLVKANRILKKLFCLLRAQKASKFSEFGKRITFGNSLNKIKDSFPQYIEPTKPDQVPMIKYSDTLDWIPTVSNVIKQNYSRLDIQKQPCKVEFSEIQLRTVDPKGLGHRHIRKASKGIKKFSISDSGLPGFDKTKYSFKPKELRLVEVRNKALKFHGEYDWSVTDKFPKESAKPAHEKGHYFRFLGLYELDELNNPKAPTVTENVIEQLQKKFERIK